MQIRYSHKDFFEQNEEIRAFFSSVHHKKNMHSHSFWEIVYVYEGEALIHTENGTKKLSIGDFVLIKPECIHSITLLRENKKATMWMCDCIFTQRYFNSIFDEYLKIIDLNCYSLYSILSNNDASIIKLSDDNANNVKHLLWMIAHEYNHYTAGSDSIIKYALINLLAYITRMYEYETTNLSGVVSKNHEIDELAKYIRSNFSYKLPLDFLAQHMHLSREYLSRYFKKHMGKTISEYLAEVRIEKAKQMLRNSSYSVGDICEYCGYSSISSFQKAFKKLTGVSPSAYKAAYKKSDN